MMADLKKKKMEKANPQKQEFGSHSCNLPFAAKHMPFLPTHPLF